MGNFNKVILLGNLTRDPELRYTPKGTAIVKLGMAINRTWKDDTGAAKEEVTFVDVDAFGRQAEVLAQYLRKGRQLFVEGRLRLDTWDDKQTGQKRSKLGVVLESFQFVDSGGARAGEEGGAAPAARSRVAAQPAPAAPAGSAPANAAPATAAPDGPPLEEDDVPF
jgi:single-strand DNA-binding protein